MVREDSNNSSATLEALRRENDLLRASLNRSSGELDDLRSSLKQSSGELDLLRAQRDECLEQLKEKDRELAIAHHQLQALLRRYYGRSSERMNPDQRLLFEDMIDKVVPERPAEDASEVDEAEVDGTSSKRKRKGHGRRKLPADLPREKVIHDLPEEEKLCPCCGTLRHIIGKQTHEQLDYIPAKLKVIEHVRLTYGCPRCEKEVSPDGPQIVTASKPMQPIEKGLAAPGLLSYVIVSKYGDHLPLHRLERILSRYGIDIARSTMCDWAAQCAQLLEPLYDLMGDQVRLSEIIHTDDTPVQVRDPGRPGKTRTGRFWVYLGDEDHPHTVFAYTPSRSRDGPMAFLRDWGKDKRVHLQADAFGGYDGIYAGEAGGRVTEVACWAHARRKFYDARTSEPRISAQALAYIRLLYDVEKQAKQEAPKAAKRLLAEAERGASAAAMNDTDGATQSVDGGTQSSGAATQSVDGGTQSSGAATKSVDGASEFADAATQSVDGAAEPGTSDVAVRGDSSDGQRQSLLAERRLALRREQAVPRLAELRAWLMSQQAERGGPVLPKSPMGQAIQYALNQWDALCVYTTDGRLAIDNNASENALRRVAVGRKNWLFAGSDNGGRTAATMFSLIATCQRHNVEPVGYFRDVLTRIAAMPVNQLGDLLPNRWHPATAD